MIGSALRQLTSPKLVVAAILVAFQYWILLHPQQPLFERPVHLILLLFLVFLWFPLNSAQLPRVVCRLIDVLVLAAVVSVGAYLWFTVPRLETRIDNVSPVFWWDVQFGIILVLLLLEAVRRTVGWILLGVILAFLLYGAFGYVLPGELGFRGFGLEEYVEILTMTTSGILGVTTETSVNFVFYFVAFGVIYSAVGGGRLFIDLAMRLVGTSRGGSAKVAIVGSSLMGTISGSAVANVATTGVFSIPLMRRSGLSAEYAGATEAIASTGGQLMPPVMGVAAFVMAELLGVPYQTVALAGVIPALAFYAALYFSADLQARKSGLGTLTRDDFKDVPSILPRLHLLLPVFVLIILLFLDFSAQLSATYATLCCFPIAFVRKENYIDFNDVMAMVRDLGRQMAEIAIPIAAIGIIIAIAIQSNIALKFASSVIAAGGGTRFGSLLLVVFGCIIMGMGLPTVAAYIIGAILYVPALRDLGLPLLGAHFFVMYYCVLSMVTPPVALASYAAAGLAGASPMKTGLIAFRMSFVAFLVPFAFVIDPALLFQTSVLESIIACTGLLISTGIWAIGVIGYGVRPLAWGDRIVIMLCGVVAIVAPTASWWWAGATGLAVAFLALNWRWPSFTLAQLLPRRGVSGQAPQAGEP